MDHRAALHDREYRHSLVVRATVGGILRAAGRRRSTTRIRGPGHSRPNRDRIHIRAELEIPTCELIQGGLVLKDDDLSDVN